MSELCLYNLEDIGWDDFCDDHIVPHPGSGRASDHSVLGDSHKKPCREVTSISNSTGDRSSGYVDMAREQGGFSSLNKRSCTMLEEDSWLNTPSGFPSSLESNSIKEVSSIVSENTSSRHVFKSNKTDSSNNEICTNDIVLGDKTAAVDKNSLSDTLGDITHTCNNVDFFENTEDKDSSEFLYYTWPEIENFEDVDMMFRSCDSTFGLGASKEDELGWFTSADNTGGAGDCVKSEFEFPCREPNQVEYISQNHDSSKSNFINDFAMTKDCSWTSEESDSYMSFVNGPAMANSKDRFIPKEQIENQVKLQNQSIGKRKEHYFGNGSFNNTSTQPKEAMKLPLSYMHSNSNPSSDLTSVNPTPSAVKSEAHDLGFPSPRDSSHTSNQLQDDPQFPVAATGKREKLHNPQGKQVQYSGDKSENHSNAEGASLVIPAELGSSLIQESTTKSTGMVDISQEAATFRQLQLVIEQLDLRTRICIRDSLYRLARSAERRHSHANLNGNCGAETDASGAFMTAETNNFMDMETDTNPIDRSVAHLLFHRPSESPSMVHGSVTSPPIMVEDMVVSEETASKIIDNDLDH